MWGEGAKGGNLAILQSTEVQSKVPSSLQRSVCGDTLESKSISGIHSQVTKQGGFQDNKYNRIEEAIQHCEMQQ